MLTNVKPAGWSERQRLFLDAYARHPTISVAARLAGVHRATVHRWLTDAAFAEALRAAYEVFFQANLVKVAADQAADQAARKRWREERERARRPMRCHYLALARAAKRR